MPNWVYTKIDVSGDPAEIKRLMDKAGKQHPEDYNAETKEVVYSTDDVFSFWNFIAPPAEAVESGEYFGTNGFVEGKVVGKTPNNWYEWNNANWDTKWDACDQSLSFDEKKPDEVSYWFSTAWSPAEPIFEAMVKEFPELDFEIYWEEEQGFGAELSGFGGEISLVKEWDTPESHADYVYQDKEDSCICANDDDEDEWYDDCPRENDNNQPEPDVVY